MEEPVASIVVGIAIGLFSAYLAAWLAFRRFQKQKLWEQKHAAYIRILEAFHNMDVSMRRIRADEAQQIFNQENVGFFMILCLYVMCWQKDLQEKK